MGGQQSHNAETYRRPYNEDSAAPDFGHNTLRLKHEQAPSGSAPAPLDASEVLVGQEWWLPRESPDEAFAAEDPQRHFQRGLVSEVLAPEDLLPRARELAREIAENTSSISVALSRQMMWRMLGASHPMEAHRLDSQGMFATGGSADAKEGVESFLQKRAPEFPGKVSADLPDIFSEWQDPPYEPGES
jgi:hypothetical protein